MTTTNRDRVRVQKGEHHAKAWKGFRCCWIGGARYSQPLGTAYEKKFLALSALGAMFVIGFSLDAKPRCFSQYARFYLLPCLQVPCLRYLLMFSLAPALALWCILRHGVRILIAQSPYEGAAAALAKILAHVFGKRVALIVENHGDFEVSLFLQRRILLPILYRLLMRQAAYFAFRQADALRTISHTTHRQVEAWAPGKLIVQFPTWTDLGVFLETENAKGREGKGPVILYVGVLIPRKGIHILLDAFARVAPEKTNAKLEIIGGQENSEYTAGLKEQAKRLGLDGRVAFLDSMSQHQLAEHMAQADVLVLPSVSEGLGRVVFEAMACGTPVIGSQVGGIPDMIQNGSNGFLVPPENTAALTDRLLWILSHSHEAQEMGKRAREFAQRFFSPEAYVQHYADLLQQAYHTQSGK